MATDAAEATVSHRLRTMTDEQLLDRFVNKSGEDASEAFRALVLRHGPMVLGVCRHILNDHQDAEDAFQAAFLVLVRKADTIRNRRVLGRWLYEVAYRIAVRAKANAARRRAHERQGAEMSAKAPEYHVGWSELKPVLHDEVNRLPEKYRTPVILCYLEGKTNEEVAQMLQWPVGTVKGRLSRARDILRSRLTQRGLALSAAFLATMLSSDTVFAEVVPTSLVDTTVDSALVVSSGDAAGLAKLSPRVSALMNALSTSGGRQYVKFAMAVSAVLLAAYAMLGFSVYAGIPRANPADLGTILLWPLDPSLSGPPPSCHAVPSAHGS